MSPVPHPGALGATLLHTPCSHHTNLSSNIRLDSEAGSVCANVAGHWMSLNPLTTPWGAGSEADDRAVSKGN